MNKEFFKAKSHILIFLLVSFIAFFHCLVLGQAYFANDLLNQYSHFRALLRQQLALGHFPLWNPYFFGGQPFFADPNVMMCYPLNYLTLLFPAPYDLGIFYFLHMFLAAWGMHFWLKSLRISETASRLGALAFALSGYFWWELIHPPILAALTWFPWWMGALEKLSKDLSPRLAFLSGLFFALIFVSGNFQMTSAFLYTGIFYFLFRLWVPAEAPSAPRKFPWKKLMVVLLFGLWGSLPLVVHMIPAYEFSKYSNRRSPDQTYETFNALFSMRPGSLYEIFFPTLGVPSGETIEMGIQNNSPPNYDNPFLGAFGFLGIWIPFLAGLSLLRKEKRLVYFLLAISALSILTAWGRYFPLHKILCSLLPTIDLSRAPFRFLVAYVGFACVLMAYGYQALERAIEDKIKISSLVFAGGLYALVFCVIGLFNLGQTWREILALALGFLGLFLWSRVPSLRRMGKLFFISSLVLPLLLSAWADFSWGPASNYDLEARFPAFSYLREHREGCRYFFGQDLIYPVQMGNQTYGWTFPQDGPMDFGIRQSVGYNPIVLTKAAEIRQLPSATYFQLMAVKGILVGKEMGESENFLHQSFGSAQLYEFKAPPPYARAPAQVKYIPEDQMLAALKSPDFNPNREAYLSESWKPLEFSPSKSITIGPNNNFSYSIAKDDMDGQTFKVHMDEGGLAVFSEIMFSGWKARLDGQPTPLLTADHAFRAVEVPAGEHSVEFHYEPAWAKPLLVGLLLWLLSALGYGLFILWRGPRASLPSPARA